MQFVNMRKLKAILKERALTSGETARYLAVQGTLLSWLFIPSPRELSFDWMYALNPLLGVAVVFHC